MFTKTSKVIIKVILLSIITFFSFFTKAEALQPINNAFVEVFGGGSHNHFIVKDLDIAGHGNRLLIGKGGVFKIKLNIYHDCTECGNAINQIIIGIAGENNAQACIWSGGQSSDGWKTIEFQLKVSAPGRHYIRARYAQAYTCDEAKKWWKVDRLDGPTKASNIGYILINR